MRNANLARAFGAGPNWFWTVAGDNSRAWSGERGEWVTDYPADRVSNADSEFRLVQLMNALGLAAPAGTPAAVITERERRLALGFNYNFGGTRGVHRIGTTEADLKGWDEVDKAASAMLALGQTSQTITIVTDTGPVAVTPVEWKQIILAATAYRQPIWAASFALQAMPSIPLDFASDSYWP